MTEERILRHASQKVEIGSGAMRTYQGMGIYWNNPGARIGSGAIIDFDASRVVPVGPDVAGENWPEVYWRRVS